MKGPARHHPIAVLLWVWAAAATAQTAPLEDLRQQPGAIPRPGPGTTISGGWEPLFDRDGSATGTVFEVPVTVEAFPRAIRIGGTGPLMVPDQLVVTCAPRLDLSEISLTSDLNPESLFASTTVPLSDITPGRQQVIRVTMASNPTSGWGCGMAFWRSSEADACPYGACAIPGSGFGETPTYEPPPDPSSVLLTQQEN